MHSSMTTDHDGIRPAGHSKQINRYTRGRAKLTLAFSRFFLWSRFVAKRYILQQKCQQGQVGTWMLGARWNNF